ncbi:MAG: hypothetical protein VX367_11895 [SAR324 cluster bacterium]|nr:hypothetical protein [SAR324 cluster bacterium]
MRGSLITARTRAEVTLIILIRSNINIIRMDYRNNKAVFTAVITAADTTDPDRLRFINP